MVDYSKVAGRQSQIYLKFRCEFGSSEEIIKHTTASFHLAVLDSSGKAIRSVALPLSATNWTGAEAPCLRAYNVGSSQFHFQPNASYVLKVSYDPNSIQPPAKRLYFSIDDCALY